MFFFSFQIFGGESSTKYWFGKKWHEVCREKNPYWSCQSVRDSRKDAADIKMKYFTPDQIFEFLDLPISTPFAALAKAAVCLQFCGQLTPIDLKGIQLQDLTEVEDGIAVNITSAKKHSFVLRRNETGSCIYRPVKRYLDALKTCGIVEGRLFRLCNPQVKSLTGKAYKETPMGKDNLRTFGRYVAEMLNLPEANQYFPATCFKIAGKMASQVLDKPKSEVNP